MNDHNKMGNKAPTQMNQGQRTPESRHDRQTMAAGPQNQISARKAAAARAARREVQAKGRADAMAAPPVPRPLVPRGVPVVPLALRQTGRAMSSAPLPFSQLDALGTRPVARQALCAARVREVGQVDHV
ncbi:MAG: hypothetical protein JWQ73_2501, partial [Variovorax sp.]|nr:hypothetical protein [Variovorax sp.]